MMATVPHVNSGSGLRKFQADGFLLDRVYNACLVSGCFQHTQEYKDSIYITILTTCFGSIWLYTYLKPIVNVMVSLSKI